MTTNSRSTGRLSTGRSSIRSPLEGKNILMGFWHNWAAHAGQGYRQGFFKEMTLTEIDPAYNVIAVAFMKGAGIPDFKPYKGSDAEFKAQIDELHSQDRVVLISLGGADAHIELHDGQEEALAERIIHLVDYYGFDGLDIDLEQDAITAADNIRVIPAALKLVKDRMRVRGRYFIISMAPEFPYLATGRSYLPYLESLDGYYDFIAPQFYNQGGDGVWDPDANGGAGQWLSQDRDDGDYKKRFLVALTKALVTGTNGYTKIDPDRFVIGLPSNNDAAATGYVSDADNVIGALEELRRQGLAIRGLMTWSVNWDEGWNSAGVPYGGEFARRYGYLTGSDGHQHNVPTGLHVVRSGRNEVELRWNAVAGASGYRVYRDGRLVGTTCQPGLLVTSLHAGTTYRFQVSSLDAHQHESARSTAVEASTEGTGNQRPSAPTGLSVASSTHSTITLHWNAPTRSLPAASYRIERNGQQVGSVTTTTFVDHGLQPDTSYTYAVYAVAANGNSSTSAATASGRTQAPDGPQAWAEGIRYAIGEQVSYQGSIYECLATHTSIREWTPAAAVTLWKELHQGHALELDDYRSRTLGIEPYHGGVIEPASRAALEFGQGDWRVYSLEAGKAYPLRAAPGGANDPDAIKYQDQPSVEPPADGQIASAGFAAAAILDRADIAWPRHQVSSYQHLDMYWHYAAQHMTRRWRYWITREDWDPSQPLSRASFEEAPFHTVQLEEHPHWSHGDALWPPQPTHHQLTLPQREGYQVLLAVWDVANTGNAFFQVIDLEFEEGGAPAVPAPVNVRIGETTAQTIELLWDAPASTTDVEFYTVYRNGQELARVTPPYQRLIDAGLEPSSTYQYSVTLSVRGEDGSLVESPQSLLVTGTTGGDGSYRPPGAPQGLHTMAVLAYEVDLMWMASSGGSAGIREYVLFRDGEEVGRVPGNSTAYTDLTVSPATRYQYFVAAIDDRGTWSLPSNVPWVQTPEDEDDGDGDVPWWSADSVPYEVGDRVRYRAADNAPVVIYRCIQRHTSNAGWNPVAAFTLWQPEGTARRRR